MDKPLVCNTSDGSLTYIDPISGQTMHAKEGAFSETLYIYGESFEIASRRLDNLRLFVFGLGLGYIELINLAQSIKFNKQLDLILSVEREPQLLEPFQGWLFKNVQSELSPIYENILKRIEEHLEVKGSQVKDLGQTLFLESRWQFLGDPVLKRDWQEFRPFHVIQYDPYSKSANPEVWSPEWLNHFTELASAEFCVFTTYASTGPLKKALSQSGFRLKPKSGFGKKRESTLAIRDSRES